MSRLDHSINAGGRHVADKALFVSRLCDLRRRSQDFVDRLTDMGQACLVTDASSTP